jgi:AraC-like DNA-binding protein
MNRLKPDAPRGILSTANADARSFQHARYYASPDLEPFVEHYWSVAWDLRGLPPERVETLPHPSVHLIFDRREGTRVSGVARGKFTRLLEGAGGVFSVKFKPGGFFPILATLTDDPSVATFTDRTVRFIDVFGAPAEPFDKAILAAPDDAARITIVEEFLRGLRPQPDANANLVATIAYAVAADRAIVKVDDLVERYALNKRALQRLFSRHVGVTPKWVIQRYRLHEAAERLRAEASVSHAALAAELGYSDQAHFVRDFKAMVGSSPAVYARGRTGER